MSKGFNKFLDMMRLSDIDDDDFEDDDLFDEDDYEEDVRPRRKSNTRPTASVTKMSAATVDIPEYEEKKPASSWARSGKHQKIVAMNKGNSEVYVIRPQEFNDAQTVTNYLKEGLTIVINMEGLDITAAQRIVDFIGGSCYALDGSLQAISSNIFIAAPNNIDVSGDLREEILQENAYAPKLGKY